MSIETKNEVTVNARQLAFLLEQGEAGHHHLFDLPAIRKALALDAADAHDPQMLERLHHIITDLAALASVSEQRAFIAELPERVQTLLVQLYFRFLDQFMERSERTLH